MTAEEQKPPGASPVRPTEDGASSVTGASAASLLAHGATSLAAGASGQFLTIVSSVLTARLLGPSGKGELAAILLWPALVASIGGLNSLGESIVFSLALSPASAKQSLSATILVISVVQAAILTAIAYAVLPMVFSRYSHDVLDSLRLYVLWIPLGLLGSNGLSIVLGRQQVGLFNALRNVTPGVTTIALVGLTVIHANSLRPAVVAYLVGSTVGTLMILGAVAFGGLDWPSGRRVGSMVRYMLKAHLGSLSELANLRADQALISLFLLPSALGLYSVAVSVTSPVVMVGNSLAPLVLAKVSGAPTAEDRGHRLVGFVKAVGFLSAVIALAILLLTKPVIGSLFGPSFDGATLSTQILLIAAFALSVKSVLNAGLKGSNRPLTTSVAEMFGAVATVGLLILLLPRYGIVGAAVASCIAYWGTAVYMLLGIWRAGLATPTAFIPRRSDFGVWRLAVSHFAAGLNPRSGPPPAK